MRSVNNVDYDEFIGKLGAMSAAVEGASEAANNASGRFDTAFGNIEKMSDSVTQTTANAKLSSDSATAAATSATAAVRKVNEAIGLISTSINDFQNKLNTRKVDAGQITITSFSVVITDSQADEIGKKVADAVKSNMSTVGFSTTNVSDFDSAIKKYVDSINSATANMGQPFATGSSNPVNVAPQQQAPLVTPAQNGQQNVGQAVIVPQPVEMDEIRSAIKSLTTLVSSLASSVTNLKKDKVGEDYVGRTEVQEGTAIDGFKLLTGMLDGKAGDRTKKQYDLDDKSPEQLAKEKKDKLSHLIDVDGNRNGAKNFLKDVNSIFVPLSRMILLDKSTREELDASAKHLSEATEDYDNVLSANSALMDEMLPEIQRLSELETKDSQGNKTFIGTDDQKARLDELNGMKSKYQSEIDAQAANKESATVRVESAKSGAANKAVASTETGMLGGVGKVIGAAAGAVAAIGIAISIAEAIADAIPKLVTGIANVILKIAIIIPAALVALGTFLYTHLKTMFMDLPLAIANAISEGADRALHGGMTSNELEEMEKKSAKPVSLNDINETRKRQGKDILSQSQFDEINRKRVEAAKTEVDRIKADSAKMANTKEVGAKPISVTVNNDSKTAKEAVSEQKRSNELLAAIANRKDPAPTIQVPSKSTPAAVTSKFGQ
jgi:hypothetical protein